MRDFIEKKLMMIRNTYLADHDRIVSDYGKEIREIDGYKGRQILELLQNADDACITHKERKMKIRLSGNQLEISNNGETFSEDGIISLMYSNLSPKATQLNKIGNKGTGFRSILSWADEIYIKSGGLSVRFSNRLAVNFLKELILEEPSVKEVFRKVPDCNYPIATLVVPNWEESTDEIGNSPEYDTRIVMTLKEGIKKEITKQLEEIDGEVLLFLNHIEILTIVNEQNTRTIKKEWLSSEETQITVLVGEQELKRKKWHINSVHDQYNGKNYDLIVAFNDDLDDTRNVLYSYFKTDIEFPFPALIHGTFNLNADRNHLLKDNPENEYILEQLIALLIRTAEKLASRNGKADYSGMALLGFTENFSREMTDMGFQDKLLKAIRKAKLLPTVNGEYMSAEPLPYFYKEPFADLCSGKDFADLLVHTDNPAILSLLEQLGISNRHYSYEYMVKAMNKLIVAGHWDLEQKVSVLNHFLFYYRHQMQNIRKDQGNVAMIPYLLIDSEGKTIKGDTVFVNPARGEQIAVPPSFARIKFLHPQMWELLIELYPHDDPRAVVSRLRSFHVNEYAFEPVANRLIVQAKRQLRNAKSPQRVHKIVAELLKWLFQVYTADNRLASRPLSSGVPMLNRKGNWMEADQLYFGDEYGNRTGEDLLYLIVPESFVAVPSMMGLAADGNQLNKVKGLLAWLGVSSYPRVSVQELKGEEKKDFLNYTIERFGSSITIEDCHYEKYSAFLADFRWGGGHTYASASASTFEHLDEILSVCETKHILSWMNEDQAIIEILHKGVESASTARVGFRLGSKSNLRYLQGDKYTSYFLWKLKNKEWISVKSGMRVSPDICCLARNIGTDFSPYVEMPDVDLFIAEQKDKRRARESLENTLVLAGVARDFSSLNMKSIYQVLLKIPEGNIDQKRVRSFYRQVIQNSDLEEWEERNETYIEFLTNGTVLAEYRGIMDYLPVKEVYYLDDRTICHDVLFHFPILQLERRKGKEKVQKFLGVKPFADIIFKIGNTPVFHPLQKVFERDLKRFLPFVYCYRYEKDGQQSDLGRLKGLEIFLCSELDAVYEKDGEEQKANITDYEYIEADKGRKVFLKLSTNKHGSLEDLRNDFKFCEVIANIMTGLLDVEGNYKDFRDLYGRDEFRRKQTVISDFEDEELDILKKSKAEFDSFTDIKSGFWQTILYAIGVESEPIDRYEEILRGARTPFSKDLILKYDDLILFADLDVPQNIPHLISLFRELGIDISYFNEHSETPIDVRPHYQTMFREFVERYESRYAAFLFTKLSTEDIEIKREFIKRKQRYRTFLPEFPNHVNVDVKSAFINLWEIVDLDAPVELDLHSVYFDNRRSFSMMHSITDQESQIFFEDDSLESLLYFKEFEALYAALEMYRVRTAEEVVAVTVAEAGETPNSKSHPIIDIDPKKPDAKVTKGRFLIGSGGGSTQKRLKQSDANGYYGEKLAYSVLKDQYGKENVTWVSENAKKAGVNADGRDGLGYDLKVKDEQGTDLYVEVKATTGSELLFFVSEEELLFAEQKGNRHFFLLITNLKDETARQFLRLRGLFTYKEDESRFQSDRFMLESREYRVRLEKP